jgi:hypothetical protein
MDRMVGWVRASSGECISLVRDFSSERTQETIMRLGLFMMPIHNPARDYLSVFKEDREAILHADCHEHALHQWKV